MTGTGAGPSERDVASDVAVSVTTHRAQDAGGGPGESMTGALTRALRAVASSPGEGVVVAAPDDPVLEAVPGRFVPVAGAQVRVGVAAGLALAGRPAVALAGTAVPALLPHAPGLVAVVTEARVAGAWWGAGWTLVQPGWPEDVGPLLAAALAASGPVVVRVRPGVPPPGTVPPSPPAFGVPRVLHEGAGLVAACGPERVRLLLDVTRTLAARGVALRALELHTARAGEGPGPEVTDRVLLLREGPLTGGVRPSGTPGGTGQPDRGGWPPGLRPVPVPDDALGAAEAVAAQVRVAR